MQNILFNIINKDDLINLAKLNINKFFFILHTKAKKTSLSDQKLSGVYRLNLTKC